MTMKKVKIYEVGYKKHPTEEQLQKIKDADNGFDSAMQLTDLNERVLVFASSRESAEKQFTSDSDNEFYNIDYWTIDYIVEHGYAQNFSPLAECNEEWADLRDDSTMLKRLIIFFSSFVKLSSKILFKAKIE